MSAAVLDACKRVDSVDVRATSSSREANICAVFPARAPGPKPSGLPFKLEVIEKNGRP